MPILTYSLKKDGQKKMAANFLAREFACHDGSDVFKVDDKLVDLLQKIRDQHQSALIIHSAFRTAEHNRNIGGSANSQHLYGRAADFHVQGVPHLLVAQYAESLGAGGIGLYPWGVHIDTRIVINRWQEVNKVLLPVTTFGVHKRETKEKAYRIAVDHKTFYVNGVPNTVRAGLLDDENYVHLRDIATVLGVAVGYDVASKQVSLTK